MPITPCVPQSAFSPEAVDAMAAVLRDACLLALKDGSDPARQAVAELIIRLASTGVYDARGLRAAVLMTLRLRR